MTAAPQFAFAQQCPVAETGQACVGGTGVCVPSTCSYEDGGVSVQEPCAFCEPVACPLAAIGQPCDAGTCTQATCSGPEAGLRADCAVCTSPPSNACDQAQSGQACSGVGVCTMTDTGALGPAGAPPGSELYYPITVCIVTPEASAQDVDAATGLGLSGGNAGAVVSARSSSGSGGGGCSVTDASAGAMVGPGLCVVALVAIRRRRAGR
jgi:hypothetical protein